MFLSLVRPDRSSSPIASMAAVMVSVMVMGFLVLLRPMQ